MTRKNVWMTELPEHATETAGGLNDNPRASRLLSPRSSQLDARAIAAKRGSWSGWSIGKCIVGVTIGLAVLTAAIAAAKWYYQPIKNQTETHLFAQPQIPSLRIVRPILQITDVQLRKVSVNGKSIALVAGKIINRAGDKMLIPHLDIVLRGKDGQKSTSWRYRPLQTSLKAGASIHFSSKFITDVRPDSVVNVKFAVGDKR